MNLAHRRLLGAAGLPAVAVVACASFVGDYRADLEVVESRIDASPLCAVEEQFIFEPDFDSDEAEEDLTAYYEAANPELIAHLGAVASRLHDGTTERGLTYIWGAAGIGKSFVTRNAFDAFAESEKCTIDLATTFALSPETLGFEVAPAPDLSSLDGEFVFNELPDVVDPGSFALSLFLNAAGCFDDDGALRPLIILDGIDEVTDASATLILREIDEFLMNSSPVAGPFLHIVVAGRPGGFASWLTDPRRTEENNELLDVFQLEAPRYDSAGDLSFRLYGYLEFANLLSGYDESEIDSYLESFSDGVKAHPFLAYSLGNLSVGNVVIEHLAPDLHETEAELKAGLFDDIIYRNTQSHGRPGAGSKLSAEYLRIIEDIAARYVDVNSSGEFAVRSEDTIEFANDSGNPMGEVRVRNVLNRGGVAILTSASTTTTRYRFEPFWLHAHLIERRNQRLDSGYAYQGCE